MVLTAGGMLCTVQKTTCHLVQDQSRRAYSQVQDRPEGKKGIIMDNLEKVEKLRERADVTYEEAKQALEQAGGDLLDAMVILEKEGKTRRPQQESYSTRYEEQSEYISVQEKVEDQKQNAPSIGKNIGRILKAAWKLILHTSFRISDKEKELFVMPSWVFVLILLLSWRLSVPGMLIAMLFGIRYSFTGQEDVSTANEILNKAGSFAEDVQSELHKERKE